jgi:ubiquinol-cytochrome c reductase cytochrome b subunit
MKDYTKGRKPEELEPFFPNEVLRMMGVALILIAVIMFLVIFLPEAKEEPANPYFTPPHIKPDWYFLPVYQALKLIPNKILGVMMQGVGILLLILLPFLDSSRKGIKKGTPLFYLLVTLVIVVIVALGIWGRYS